MHVTRSMSLSRFLISIAALALLAGLLLLPDQAHAENGNEAPEITSPPDTTSIAENSTTVVTFSATDVDALTMLTWSVEPADDGGKFDITSAGGVLSFNTAPNFEMPTDTGDTVGNNTYVVTVKVTDNGSSAMSDTHTITVTIRNVDEPGTVRITGTLSGGEPLMAAVTDEDGIPTTITWQWARGDSSGGTFTDISGATSASYTTVAADVNKYLQATASYTDPESSGKTAEAVTGQIGAGNSEPTFNQTAVTREFPENSAPGVSVGAPVTATDSDSDTLTYGLKAGSDSGSFTIVPTSGQIQTKSGVTYNYESAKDHYSVHVTVRDSKDAAGDPDTDVDAEFVVTLNLTDVNEAPTFKTIGLTDIPLLENAVNVFAVYEATDEDGDTLMWSLEGDDVGHFTLVPNTLGRGIQFTTPPDYENPTDDGQDNVYLVTMKVTDPGGLSDTRAATVTISNSDEPGTVTISGSLSGGSMLTASVTDIDGAPTSVTWQWARGMTATGPWEGNIIANATSASYTTVAADVNKYLRATVFYTDPESSGKTAEAVTGQIGAGNSEPTFNQTAVTREFPENSAPGVSVVGATVAATDSDNGDTLTYSLQSGTDDSGSFDHRPRIRPD